MCRLGWLLPPTCKGGLFLLIRICYPWTWLWSKGERNIVWKHEPLRRSWSSFPRGQCGKLFREILTRDGNDDQFHRSVKGECSSSVVFLTWIPGDWLGILCEDYPLVIRFSFTTWIINGVFKVEASYISTADAFFSLPAYSHLLLHNYPGKRGCWIIWLVPCKGRGTDRQ